MFVDEEMLGLNVFRSATGVLLRVYLAWSFYLGPALTLPFLLLPLTLPRNFSLKDIEPMTGALVVVLTVSVIGSFLVNFYSAHYSAPNTGLIIAAIVLSIRQLRTWGRSGLFLSRAIPVICVVSLVARAAAVPFHIPLR
jgi:hypothetical protein